MTVTSLAELLQQPRHHALLVRNQRRQRRSSDLGGDQLGCFGHLAAAVSERHLAAAAVLRIVKRTDEAARAQPIDYALDGGSVEIDQLAEMVLRTGADFVELGERGKLS